MSVGADRDPVAGPDTPPGDVRTELRALRHEVARLNRHRFIRLHDSVIKIIGVNFLRGLAFGLGTVLGASVLLSLLAWSLSQVEFLPIIGEWAADVARYMREAAEP